MAAATTAQPQERPLRVLNADLRARLRAINTARTALQLAGYTVIRQDVWPGAGEPPLLTLEHGDAQLLLRATLMRVLKPGDLRARVLGVDITWAGALS